MGMKTNDEYLKKAERFVERHRKVLRRMLRRTKGLKPEEIQALKWVVDSVCVGITRDVQINELRWTFWTNDAC